jgi:hypothetical protein
VACMSVLLYFFHNFFCSISMKPLESVGTKQSGHQYQELGTNRVDDRYD